MAQSTKKLSIKLFYGEDAYSAEQAYRQYLAAQVDPSGMMAISHLYDDETDAPKLHTELSTVPFFNTRRLFVFHSFLGRGNKTVSEMLADYISSLPASTELIFWETGTFDKRLRLAKELLAKAETSYFAPQRPADVMRFALTTANKFQVKLSSDSLDWLVREHGANSYELLNEIKKLAHWSRYHDGQIVNIKTVQLLSFSAANLSAFSLTDSIVAGNTIRSLGLYHDLIRQGEAPLMILALLVSQWRSIALLALTLGSPSACSSGDLARTTKINPYVIQKLTPIARSFSPEALKKSYGALVRTDNRIKTGELQEEVALPLLIIQLCATVKKSQKSFRN